MKSNLVKIMVSLYLGLMSMIYIGFIILREVYELEFVRREFYSYLLIAISSGVIISKFNRIKKSKTDNVIIIFFLFIVLVSFEISTITATEYISLESPLGTHRILAENTIVGFETGTTHFYKIKMFIFKDRIATIMLEKTGGIIQSNDITTLDWISEDILKIEFKHYNKELHIYKLNFNSNKVSEDVDILH